MNYYVCRSTIIENSIFSRCKSIEVQCSLDDDGSRIFARFNSNAEHYLLLFNLNTEDELIIAIMAHKVFSDTLEFSSYLRNQIKYQ